MKNDWIIPDWPAPGRVHAVTTTRNGGVSLPPYASFNLGDHVGDDLNAVTRNREHLSESLSLSEAPHWLSQVHGCHVINTGTDSSGTEADASFSTRPGKVSVVLTADCLPILLCDVHGKQVAAIIDRFLGQK